MTPDKVWQLLEEVAVVLERMREAMEGESIRARIHTEKHAGLTDSRMTRLEHRLIAMKEGLVDRDEEERERSGWAAKAMMDCSNRIIELEKKVEALEKLGKYLDAETRLLDSMLDKHLQFHERGQERKVEADERELVQGRVGIGAWGGRPSVGRQASGREGAGGEDRAAAGDVEAHGEGGRDPGAEGGGKVAVQCGCCESTLAQLRRELLPDGASENVARDRD